MKQVSLGVDTGVNMTNLKQDSQEISADVPTSLAIPSDDSRLRGLMLSHSLTVQDGWGVAKRGKKELDPVMDYLINADSQGLAC